MTPCRIRRCFTAFQ